ncbi:acyltransferase [Piscinibacter sakaiensis]|uniref:acyltransferase n=1 Tax=Piscinibacter sakaiensis TaxID=1547922 RepID=UPI003AAC335E
MTDIREITGTWDYTTLPGNVRLGSDCFLERKASFVRYRSTQSIGLDIGDRVRAYTWAEFNIEPAGTVSIGNDSLLVGPVFMCAQRISIGERVVVSYHVTIADSDFHPLDPQARRLDALANAPGGDLSLRPRIETAPVVIEDDVWIGIGALILKGARIGRGARVMAGTVVTRDIPPGAIVAGNPGRLIEAPGR